VWNIPLPSKLSPPIIAVSLQSWCHISLQIVKVISDKIAAYSFSVAKLSGLADLGMLVGLNYVLETCSSLSPTRLKKCHLLENYGICGGHLFNGTVIYVDIVKVFREHFQN